MGGAVRRDQPDTSPMTPQEINNRKENGGRGRQLKNPLNNVDITQSKKLKERNRP